MKRDFWLNKFFAGLMALLLVAGALETLRPSHHAHAASSFAVINCDNFKAVSSASSVQVITAGNANMFVYICSYSFGSIGGSDFSVVEGTGTTCATNTLAMAGGTTAATGYGLAANGVIAVGAGQGVVTKTAVAGDNVCLIISGTGPLAGVVGWTTAPF